MSDINPTQIHGTDATGINAPSTAQPSTNLHSFEFIRVHSWFSNALGRALVGLLLVCPVKGSEQLPIWPGAVAGDHGAIGPERVRAPAEAPTKNAKWITNVTKPTLTILRPGKDKNVGTAIIICPGGGYWNLAWDLEGEEVATRLNAAGITACVLKYRVPRR